MKIYYKFAVPLKNRKAHKNLGPVVQLVRIPACHAGGREFESRPDRILIHNNQNPVGGYFRFDSYLIAI